jgi:hypothetical protein
MKIIKKEVFQRTTGLVERVRKAAKSNKRVALKTAADVQGYWSLATHLKALGFITFCRRRGKKVFVYVNQLYKPRTPDRPNLRLRRALLKLKSDDDCVALTTPLEAAQFQSIRGDLGTRFGIYFRARRNCSDVWVWKAKL